MKYDDILNIQDLIVAPIYLVLLIFIARRLKKKYTRRHPEIRRYFMPALYVRFIGCFLSALMYQYYYHGGDTFTYFNGAVGFSNAFWDNPLNLIKILNSNANELSSTLSTYFIQTGSIWFTQGTSTFVVLKISGLINLLTFNSYLSIGFILTFFSFLGCWKLFEVFYDQYPHLHKKIALATLFIPSVFFWGAAGLMKDTIIMAAIGYVVWGSYFLFIKRRKKLIALVYIIIGGILVLKIKTYVALSLFPALALWIFLQISANVKNKTVKLITFPFLLLVGIATAGIFLQNLSEIGNQKYAMDKVMDYAQSVQVYHKFVTERSGGVGYDLGTFSPTVSGAISMFPKAINVTLFRPYPWEMRKIILSPAILEALFSLIFTIYVILRVGLFRSFRIVISTPVVAFCLAFSLVFAFAVGFSTYNFGALVRYKIPCLPFYFLALVILLDKRKKKTQRKFIAPKPL